jgi:1,4-alpha-glucan branching enzyme
MALVSFLIHFCPCGFNSKLLGVIQLDPWLEPFRDVLKSRFSYAQDWIKKINDAEGGLEKFSRVYNMRRFVSITY